MQRSIYQDYFWRLNNPKLSAIRDWLLDRWIVHVALLIWFAPQMYKELLSISAYVGRLDVREPIDAKDLVKRIARRGIVIDSLRQLLWFHRGKF